MEFILKYKEDANLGMVSYNEALTTTVNAINEIEAVRAFAIQKINEGFTNGESVQDLIDILTGLSGTEENPLTIDNMLYAVNSLGLMKNGKEFLILG